MAYFARRGIEHLEGHVLVRDGRVGKSISIRRPRRPSDPTSSRHIERAHSPAIDAGDRARSRPDVFHPVVGIRSDLAAGEVVRRIRHVADRDRTWIAHRHENPLPIRTDRGNRVRRSLENLHQIGRGRLIRLLRQNFEKRRKRQTHYRDETTNGKGHHGI